MNTVTVPAKAAELFETLYRVLRFTPAEVAEGITYDEIIKRLLAMRADANALNRIRDNVFRLAYPEIPGPVQLADLRRAAGFE